MQPAPTLMSKMQVAEAVADDRTAEVGARDTRVIFSHTISEESTRHITVKRSVDMLAMPSLLFVLNMLGYVFACKFVL